MGDDSFDIDEGYNGQLQFLLSLQDENSNRAIEWDGSTESDDRAADTSTLPSYSNAIISNMTAIGIGVNGTSLHEDSNVGMEIRDNAAGQVWNSIFTEFSKSILDIEKTSSSKGTASTTGSGSFGSQALLENGVLAFKGNIFYNGGKGNTALGTAEDDQVASDIIFATTNGNSFSSDPKLAVIGTVGGTGILATSAQPQASSPAKTGAATFSGLQTSFLTQTTYRGAFDGFTDWAESWTKVDSSDYLATLSSDLDSDGLTLAQEITTNQNTDPSKSDTDGDGISDLTDPNPTSTTPTDNAKIVSVNVRGTIGAGNDKRIMAFLLNETGNVFSRAIGPTLAEYGLPLSSLLPDPQIRLFKYNAIDIFSGSFPVPAGDNDNYSTNSNLSNIETARKALIPVVNTNNAQAISMTSLDSGFYTLQVEDEDGSSTGIGTATVDLTDTASTAAFTHVSARGLVSTNEFMFGGFQIVGTGTRKIFVRGRGPSLGVAGVTNTMSDPKIVVFKYQNDPNDDLKGIPSIQLASNDDYTVDTNGSTMRSYSTSLYPNWPVLDNSEPGMILTLGPGYYTVQLQSKTDANNGNAWIGVDDVTDR